MWIFKFCFRKIPWKVSGLLCYKAWWGNISALLLLSSSHVCKISSERMWLKTTSCNSPKRSYFPNACLDVSKFVFKKKINEISIFCFFFCLFVCLFLFLDCRTKLNAMYTFRLKFNVIARDKIKQSKWKC